MFLKTSKLFELTDMIRNPAFQYNYLQIRIVLFVREQQKQTKKKNLL